MSDAVPLLTTAPGYAPGKDRLPSDPPSLLTAGLDGTSAVNNFSVAEYNSFGTGTLNAKTQAEIDAEIAAASSTNKQYVDSRVSALTAQLQVVSNSVVSQIADVSTTINHLLDDKIAKAGDTMTGPLELVGDPVDDNSAVNKHYVDTAIQEIVINQSFPVDGGTF